jgi:hypothetical protein
MTHNKRLILNKINENYVRQKFREFYKSLNILDFLSLEETLFNFYKAGFELGSLHTNEVKKELLVNNLQLQTQLLILFGVLDGGDFYDKIVLEAIKIFCTHSLKCTCGICNVISKHLLEELSRVPSTTNGSV